MAFRYLVSAGLNTGSHSANPNDGDETNARAEVLNDDQNFVMFLEGRFAVTWENAVHSIKDNGVLVLTRLDIG
jgi:hypothetical protein